mmetsp:Transcript_52445/g.162712  ORF Transcript_52445/g.162712 Transcript_52445/m.162712 type:complete len:337 (-) Transcript_52445:871-1881(-)
MYSAASKRQHRHVLHRPLDLAGRRQGPWSVVHRGPGLQPQQRHADRQRAGRHPVAEGLRSRRAAGHRPDGRLSQKRHGVGPGLCGDSVPVGGLEGVLPYHLPRLAEIWGEQQGPDEERHTLPSARGRLHHPWCRLPLHANGHTGLRQRPGWNVVRQEAVGELHDLLVALDPYADRRETPVRPGHLAEERGQPELQMEGLGVRDHVLGAQAEGVLRPELDRRAAANVAARVQLAGHECRRKEGVRRGDLVEEAANELWIPLVEVCCATLILRRKTVHGRVGPVMIPHVVLSGRPSLVGVDEREVGVRPQIAAETPGQRIDGQLFQGVKRLRGVAVIR